MPTLSRTLGTPMLTLFGLGMILGAGIYSVIGTAAAGAGEGLWLSFVIASVVAALTAFSYAELAAMYPKAGAEYIYLRAAFPARRWFAAGMGGLIALAAAGTAATVALGFAGYLSSLAPVPEPLAACALLGAVVAVNLLGVRMAGWANALATAAEAGGLVIVIALGIGSGSFGEGVAADLSVPAVMTAAPLVFFAFLGFENLANLAEEVVDPGKALPRAIFISLVVSAALYVLVAIAVVALATPEELGASSAPLATAVGSRWSGLLSGVALFATANTALIAILAGSRMLYRIGKDGDLPALLGRVSEGRKVPRAAVIFVGGVALALVPFGDIAIVSSIASFASLVGFCAIQVAVIALRFREPSRERPFRIPLAIGRVPLLPVCGALASIGLASQLPVPAIALGTGGLVAFAVLARLRGTRTEQGVAASSSSPREGVEE